MFSGLSAILHPFNVSPTLWQEKEIAAAALKLAECQETIHLLSKQLTALQPHPESKASQFDEKQKEESL